MFLKIQDRRQIKNTDSTQTKHNPEKANNAKHSKTILPWFSHLLRHSAWKWGGLILEHFRAHVGTAWSDTSQYYHQGQTIFLISQLYSHDDRQLAVNVTATLHTTQTEDITQQEMNSCHSDSSSWDTSYHTVTVLTAWSVRHADSVARCHVAQVCRHLTLTLWYFHFSHWTPTSQPVVSSNRTSQKKLKPDKFFMANHLRTTVCHRIMVSHDITCSPT